MSTETNRPEPDRVEGAPHPRETERLLGQEKAQGGFLEAFNSGRLHHGWLLTGPRGIGKSTLAWTMAKFLIATPSGSDGGLFGDAPQIAETLEISPDHPVSHRMMAGSEPALFVLRRPYDEKSGKLKSQITVDEVRRLKNFFALSAADGGRRVVIVDSADEMNVNAANALLKVLEEPPADATLILISHQPSALLPTIRSRCRELRLSPLGAQDMEQALAQAGVEISGDANALAQLSGGSVGEAIRVASLGGMEMYGELVGLFSGLPKPDRQRALKLAEAAATRGAETRFDLLLDMIDLFLARLARTGAIGAPPQTEAVPGEAGLLSRLAPSQASAHLWADAAQLIGQRTRHGQAVNLDPAALVLDTVFRIQKTAAQT